MTREEAIEKLEAFAPFVVDDTRQALDMAIEALQAEPTIRCKECKHFRLCNEDTHLIACGYEWCTWWQRPVISTGYCHCGVRMD